MKRKRTNRLLISLLLGASCCAIAPAEEKGNRKVTSEPTAGSGMKTHLNQTEQQQLLARRLRGGDTNGSFDSFASLLYAIYDIGIHTESKEINAVVLETAFVESYSPTLREVLDAIAWQTNASWKYDGKAGDWVFSKAKAAIPFSLTKADKWTEKKQTTYVSYQPSTFPVGMDVYCLGNYSVPNGGDKKDFFVHIRDEAAVWFASHFKQDVTLDDMQKVSVAEDEALYFEAPTQRPNITWRQWVLVHGGRAFVIVSTVPDSDKQLLSDVQAMVKSFRATSSL